MAHAELCPVCIGKGVIFGVEASSNCYPSTTCHGCNGKGWVEVGDTFPSLKQNPWPLDPSNGDPMPPVLTMCSHPGTDGKMLSHPC